MEPAARIGTRYRAPKHGGVSQFAHLPATLYKQDDSLVAKLRATKAALKFCELRRKTAELEAQQLQVRIADLAKAVWTLSESRAERSWGVKLLRSIGPYRSSSIPRPLRPTKPWHIRLIRKATKLVTVAVKRRSLEPRRPEAAEASLPGAACSTFNRSPLLFVDLSSLVASDEMTGIHRVAKEITRQLLQDDTYGLSVRPIYFDKKIKCFCYATRFASEVLGIQITVAENAPVDAQQGDSYLALDVSIFSNSRKASELHRWRENGIKIFFIIYDILPIKFPEYFTDAGAWFLDWLRFVVNNSSGVICISKTVADEFVAWCERGDEERSIPLPIGYFHLGADYRPPKAPDSKLLSSPYLEAAIKGRKSVLMVGTIEPRKGHRQALEAMDRLWSIGFDVNLIIAGKRGWMMDGFLNELTSHSEFGERLFWLEGLSDGQLSRLYQSTTVLLAASIDEGFGLPLIEAARYGLPIIARDIAVFREVMGNHATYFAGASPRELADALHLWFDRSVDQSVPKSNTLPVLTWQESAMQLREVLFRDRWYVCWRSLRSVRF